MKFKIPVDLLQCPDCHSGSISIVESHNLVCGMCNAIFPIVDDRPVLLRHDNALFSMNAYHKKDDHSIKKNKLLWVPKASVNLSFKRVLSNLRYRLNDGAKVITILVVGSGKQRAWLNELLVSDISRQKIIYSDIDTDADVDLFCDGHDLPFKDDSIDAVVTTAVLEHVLYPEKVAAEIARVIKPGGLLYSELPFMQQVHEGAYDFTRFTLSGHRRLFNYFLEIESGMVAGPSTALVWSIENFILAFVRKALIRKITKALVRIIFGWLRYFDYLLVNRPEAMDAASSTFFSVSNLICPFLMPR